MIIRIACRFAALLLCTHVWAATCTWTGGGADDKWSNKDNWDTCTGLREVPLNTDTLIFPDGASHKTNTNDISNLQPWALQLNGLNYDISGNSVALTTGISVNTPAGGFADLGPRFRPDIVLLGTQTFTCTAGKFLYVDGDINLNGKDLGIDGACNTALRGAVSGFGAIKKFGTGSLYLQSGTYTYGGTTTINAGYVYVGSATGLGSTGNGTTVNANGTLSLYLGITLGETILVDGGTIENFIGDNTITGDVTLNAPGIIDVAPATTLTMTGAVTNGLTKEGTGTLVMTNVAAAVVVDAGLVEATGSMGPVVVIAGATIYASGAIVYPLVVYAGGTFSPGTRATPGTVTGTIFEFDPNGYVRARLGKISDRISLSSTFVSNSAGFRRFIFSDGVTPPQVGVKYVLIDYPSQLDYDVTSFTYTYEGTGPGAMLTGDIAVSATQVTFTPTAVKSDLIFRNGHDP